MATAAGKAVALVTFLALLALLTGGGPTVAGAVPSASTPETGPLTPGRAFAGTDPQPSRAGEPGGGAGRELVVPDTTAYPARAVGRLTFVQNGTPGTCAGFLIDRNSVVTAAHCVHRGDGDTPGAWSTDLVFDPGANGSLTPYRACNGIEAFAPAPWRLEGVETSDYAVVQLDCGIGRRTGWYGLWLAGTGNAMVGRSVRVRSYPSDLPGQQWRGGGAVTATTPRLVFHNAGPRAGGFGGPVFVSSPACGGPCAVTVQARAPHGVGAGVHARWHHGPRFTLQRFNQILRWAGANG